MRILKITSLIFFVASSAQLRADERDIPATSPARVIYRENKGQVRNQLQEARPDVLYYGSVPGMDYYLKQGGVSYQLYKKMEGADSQHFRIQRIDIAWVGANTRAQVSADKPESAEEHFYNAGNAKGVRGVKSFGAVRYHELYKGIDLKYYSEKGQLKYDYLVSPHADYKQIKLKLSGIEKMVLNSDGSVTIKTALGHVVEGQPKAYQEGRPITAEWVLSGDELSFELGAYDPAKPLVIDPLVHIWSVQYGFGLANMTPFYYMNDVATDNSGDYYGVSHFNQLSGPGWIAGMIKYNANNTISWSKQLAASFSFAYSAAYSIAAKDNNVYVCGFTSEVSNIATSGAYQTTLAGSNDAFLIRLDSSGNTIWSTYYGGTGSEGGNSCAIDSSGNIYMSGTTNSTAGIATPGAFQVAYAGGASDAFITKFDTAGGLLWASYFGGAGDELSAKCYTDSLDHLLLSSSTTGSSGLATPGAHQAGLIGTTNGLIARFDGSGSQVWCTYYGAGETTINDVCAGAGGDIYCSGTTNSMTDIASPGAYQSTLSGIKDAFLVKFNSSGSRQWASYFGAAGEEEGNGCTYSNGKVYLAGSTSSDSAFTTPDAYAPNFMPYFNYPNGPVGFITEFTSSGQSVFTSYDNNYKTVKACASNANGDVFLAGHFIGYGFDPVGVLSELQYCSTSTPTVTQTPIGPICQGSPVTLSTPSIAGATYLWYKNGAIVTNATNSSFTTTNAGSYHVKVTTCLAAVSSPVSISFLQAPTLQVAVQHVPCSGGAVGALTATSTGGLPPYSYFLNNQPVQSPFIDSLLPGNYVVMVSDSNNCTLTSIVTIDQNPNTTDMTVDVTNARCADIASGGILITPTGGTAPFTYYLDNVQIGSTSVNGLIPGTYLMTVADSFGCSKNESVSVYQDTVTAPSQPLAPVCAVTVDSTTGKNLIIWEKDGIATAKEYNIYRETSISGQYQLLGSQTASDFSTFLDTTSVPHQQAYNYKISETDSCGNEWPKSTRHKTIHLTANIGVNGEVNLIWNKYLGKTYSTHYIMRSDNGGPFMSLNQVSSTTTSFSDLTPPAGQKEYRIDIDLPTACNPAKTTAYDRIASNIVVLEPTALGSVSANHSIQIVPNPTTNDIRVIGVHPEIIELRDAVGKVVRWVEKQQTLSMKDLANGLYFIRLFDRQGMMIYRERVVKQ